MKKFKRQVSVFGCALVFMSSLSAFAADVSPAKATELSLHRVEREVILKKVEEGFLNLVTTLKTELIAHQGPSDPAFKTTIIQQVGSDGAAKTMEIVLAGDGKPVSFAVLPGGTAPAVPKLWVDVDPTTLLENSLHYVLENNATNPDLVAFDQATNSMSLEQGTDAAGKPVAVVHFHSTATTRVLTETLNLDGTFVSYQLN